MALTFPAFHNAQLRHPSWLAASDVALATWMKLVCRCAEDENSGRLVGARRWTERMWIGAANVGLDGVSEAVSAALASWEDDDLIVWGYDLDAEVKARKARDNGQFGILGAEHGKKGGRPRKDGKPPGSGNSKPLPKPPLSDPNLSVPLPSSPPDRSAPAEGTRSDPPPPPPERPQVHVVQVRRVYMAAKSLSFLSVAEVYPNQHRLNEAAQVWQELVEMRGGGPAVETALAAEVLGAFRRGFLKRHPYNGEPRFVPKLETFIANQSWLERAPRAAKVESEDELPERGSHG